MSSLRVLSSGLSERPAIVAAYEREKMEAGIDLFAMATVAGVATEYPPPIETIAAVESAAADTSEIDSPISDSITPRPPADASESSIDDGVWTECFAWMRANVHWYAVSFVVHLVVFAALLFILGRFRLDSNDASGMFQPVDDGLALKGRLHNIEIPSGAPEDPTELNASVLLSPEIRAVTAKKNDDSATFQKEGGGRAIDSDAPLVGGAGGFTVRAPGPGPLVAGAGGIGAERGTSDRLGNGGSGDGFAGRGKGHRD
ncbi:MAG TPA: hypothetical protein VG056_05685, partial [Pirellulales bacterium]|nr:hypothetical protein [Pirellulales bacterium]